MAYGSFSKVGRWTLTVVAVAVLASVALAAGGVQVVSAKPVANTAVVVLKNSGAQPVGGTLVVNAMGTSGQLMQSTASFTVGADGLATVVAVFDAPIWSIGGIQCGEITDSPNPF